MPLILSRSSLRQVPKWAELPEIKPVSVPEGSEGKLNVCSRDEETKARYWSVPGMAGYMHRNGGLEKDYIKGNLSTVPENHEKMVLTRGEKIQNVANYIPDLVVEGDKDGDLLVIGWGSTHGHLISAVNELNKEGKKVALAQFNYIKPLPKNSAEIIRKYKKVVVCELNNGQFANYLRSCVENVHYNQYNKSQGQPFTVSELKECFIKLMEE